MADNPIKHSEIVQQGNPAKEAIKGLQELEAQFTKTKKTLEGGIPGLLARGNGANPTSKAGQDEIKNLQKDVEKLVKANKLLEDQIKRLNQAKKQASGVDKEIEANNRRELTLKNRLIAAEQQYGAESAKAMAARKNLLKYQYDAGKLTAEETKQLEKLNATLQKHDAKIGDHQRNVGNYANAIKGVIASYVSWTAAGYALVTMFKKAVQGAMEDERQERKLMFAVNQNAAEYAKLIKIKEKYIQTTIFTEDEIYNALNVAAALGRTAEETDKMLRVASGLANVMGTDLDTAMTQLAATFEGSKGRLAKYNGAISDLTEEQLKAGMAVDLLDDKIGRFATVGLDTASGNLKTFSKNWEDFTEKLAAKTMPIVNFIIEGFNKLLGPGYQQRWMDKRAATATENLLKSVQAVNVEDKKRIDASPKKEAGIKKETSAIKEQTAALVDLERVYAELFGMGPMQTFEGAGIGAPTINRLQSQPGQVNTGTQGQSGIVGSGNQQVIPQTTDIWMQELDRVTAKMNAVGSGIQTLLSSISQMFQQQMMNEMALVEERFDQEEMLLARSFDNKVISEQQYNSKKAVLEKKKKEQETKIQKEYAKKQQKIQLTQAIIGTALAVVNALQTQPFIVGLIMAGLAAAAGAVEIATIAGQEFEKGGHGQLGEKQQGTLRGKRHTQGGVNLGEIGTAEAGEYFGIINRGATSKYGDDLGLIFDALNQKRFEKVFSPRPQVNVTVDNKWSKKLYEQASKPETVITVTDRHIITRTGNYTQKINRN